MTPYAAQLPCCHSGIIGSWKGSSGHRVARKLQIPCGTREISTLDDPDKEPHGFEAIHGDQMRSRTSLATRPGVEADVHQGIEVIGVCFDYPERSTPTTSSRRLPWCVPGSASAYYRTRSQSATRGLEPVLPDLFTADLPVWIAMHEELSPSHPNRL